VAGTRVGREKRGYVIKGGGEGPAIRWGQESGEQHQEGTKGDGNFVCSAEASRGAKEEGSMVVKSGKYSICETVSGTNGIKKRSPWARRERFPKKNRRQKSITSNCTGGRDEE